MPERIVKGKKLNLIQKRSTPYNLCINAFNIAHLAS